MVNQTIVSEPCLTWAGKLEVRNGVPHSHKARCVRRGHNCKYVGDVQKNGNLVSISSYSFEFSPDLRKIFGALSGAHSPSPIIISVRPGCRINQPESPTPTSVCVCSPTYHQSLVHVGQFSPTWPDERGVLFTWEIPGRPISASGHSLQVCRFRLSMPIMDRARTSVAM